MTQCRPGRRPIVPLRCFFRGTPSSDFGMSSPDRLVTYTTIPQTFCPASPSRSTAVMPVPTTPFFRMSSARCRSSTRFAFAYSTPVTDPPPLDGIAFAVLVVGGIEGADPPGLWPPPPDPHPTRETATASKPTILITTTVTSEHERPLTRAVNPWPTAVVTAAPAGRGQWHHPGGLAPGRMVSIAVSASGAASRVRRASAAAIGARMPVSRRASSGSSRAAVA